jgi:uncharacterized metal-binding protein
MSAETATEENKSRMVYACSGVANTGLLADRIARGWMQAGEARMSCLAAVGAGHAKFLSEAGAASECVVIDGCPISCGKHIFETNGLDHRHVMTTEFGVVKGETKITDEVVQNVSGQMLAQIESGS